MKKGVFVEFKPDGTEVQISGSGFDVYKAIEAVFSSIDKSTGSTALVDEMMDRLIDKRKQAKEEKTSPLFGLVMMMEAIGAIKSGERESFNSFYDQFMRDFENKIGHSVKPRSNIGDNETNRPNTTSAKNSIQWGPEHQGRNVTFIGRVNVSKKGVRIPHESTEKWLIHPVLNELIGNAIPLFKVGDSYCIVRDTGEVITMEAF